jgi:hypothetical protein
MILMPRMHNELMKSPVLALTLIDTIALTAWQPVSRQQRQGATHFRCSTGGYPALHHCYF